MFGISYRKFRDIVNTMRTQGYVIGSNGDGYWWCRTAQEVDGTILFLESYIKKIAAAIVALKKERERMLNGENGQGNLL
jgi:hypothetical protein